jgi:ERCC4-type nuclease
MRNYELIKKIWSIGNMKVASSSTKLTAIENLIEKHRPEIAGKLPTEESLTEEMRKYPHRDNHMD